MKKIAVVFIVSILVYNLFLIVPAVAQETKPCDQCGMTVDATGQNRFKIVDGNGTSHVACCPICAFKMIKTYGQLNITSFCDYNGPSYPITIVAKNYGSSLTLVPQTAQVILGGGCAKNRLVYNSAAGDTLLAAPNNGTSKWLSPMTNATVAANATRMGVAQSILLHGGGVTIPCDQCGMNVDTIGQARFKVFDANGNLHPACCPVCALRMLKTYGQLNITSFCDYYGPSVPITITSKNYAADTTVNPSTALVIIGGSCSKNRLVSSSTAADLLLASPNNGTSSWLSPLSNATVASNATRLSVPQAALQYGEGPAATPTPSPSPTPTVTPSGATTQPTATVTPTQKPAATPTATPDATEIFCETCGMVVTADDQFHFKIIDGQNQTRKVECIMCALNLIKFAETLHIETFCDWYGPNYKITIDSTGYGAQITVNPDTAMYLYNGDCENNRIAYNQTAADNLKTGYSQYTSLLQQHDWLTNPEVIPITQALDLYVKKATLKTAFPTTEIVVASVAVVIALIGVAVYLKSKKSSSKSYLY
jgi:hypothetical protein